jgi:SAM-dependent methyltransferase
MLTMASVGPGDEVIDLGSGDGRIVISAVRDFGARHGLGIEINPRLVAAARAAAVRARIAGRAEFREQDLFDTDFSAATVLTMYLLPDLNLRLRPKILAMSPGTRVVSHEFGMGEWQPDLRRTVLGDDHPRGPSVVYFWVVPAHVDGRWTWDEDGRTAEMTVRQAFQQVEPFMADGRASVGTLNGDHVRVVVRQRSAGGGGEEIVYEGRVHADAIDGTVSGPGDRQASWRATRR